MGALTDSSNALAGTPNIALHSMVQGFSGREEFQTCCPDWNYVHNVAVEKITKDLASSVEAVAVLLTKHTALKGYSRVLERSRLMMYSLRDYEGSAFKTQLIGLNILSQVPTKVRLALDKTNNLKKGQKGQSLKPY